MIEVYIEESGFNFYKKVGLMTPKQIEEFIALINEQGVMYNNEKYVYIESYYDCNTNAYSLIVDLQQ